MEALKSQHTRLLQALHELSFAESSQDGRHTLPLTVEEDEYTTEPEQQDPLSPGRDQRPLYSPYGSRHSKRASVAPSVASSVREWFDAWDGDEPGAQEFVLEADTSQDDALRPSGMIHQDSQDTAIEDDRSSVDTDVAEDSPPPTAVPSSPTPSPTTPMPPASRRTQLPATVTGDEGSLFTVLKKNVGKVCGRN